MPNPYRVVTAILANGERLPLLIDSQTGVPLWHPNLYALTTLRTRALAVETLRSYLTAIELLALFQRFNGIDLDARLLSGEQLLKTSEVDSLAAVARMQIDAYVDSQTNAKQVAQRPTKVTQLFVKQRTSQAPAVDSSTVGTRLRTIAAYIEWYGRMYVSQLSDELKRHRIADDIGLVATSIRVRIPPVQDMNRIGEREGLAPEALEELWNVITPGNPRNPWKSPIVQRRNQLIVYLLYSLGVRLGELLGIQLHDVHLDTQRVDIKRRPDNPDDPRKRSPVVKTLSRSLPLKQTAVELLREYLRTDRLCKPVARSHDYLLVETRNGQPMSASAVDKMMQKLQKNSPNVGRICAHIMRHTWNDVLSEQAEASNMTPEQEIMLREYAMGWVKGSKSAAVYTQRYSRMRATKALLEHQSSLYREPKWDESAGEE